MNKSIQSIPPLNPDEWQYFGLWPQGLFSAYFWGTWFDESRFIGLGFRVSDPGVFIFKGGHFFYKKRVLAELKDQVWTYLQRGDGSVFSTFESSARKVFACSILQARSLPTDSVSVEDFDTFLGAAREITAYWCFAAVHLQTVIEQFLHQAVVESKIPAENVPALIPKFDTPLLEQQREARQIKAEIGARSQSEVLQDEGLLKRIQEHVNRYAWIEIANWIGEEFTIARFFQQLEYLEKSSSGGSAHEVPESLRHILVAFSQTGYVKQAGAEYLAMYSQLSRKFLLAVATSIGVSYDELMWLTHEEVRLYLETGTKDRSRVTRRDGNWLVMAEPDRKCLFTDDAGFIADLERTLLPVDTLSPQKVMGTVANPGKATGTVKVVRNLDEFSKLQTGDVLVTTMTTPDFVILMQKASAIVTDIGGLLSHAAIVSREIGKPCIIGTKNATRVLKNGDKVEVDANSGTVTILI